MTGFWQNICLGIIGTAGGLGVAAGVFAFISMLGVIPRLCHCFGMADHVHTIETCVAVGAAFGSVFSVFSLPLPIGRTGLVFFGIFSGIFVGALAMSLAEALRVIPILCQRLKLKKGLPYVILFIALGKMTGCFVQLFLWRR